MSQNRYCATFKENPLSYTRHDTRYRTRVRKERGVQARVHRLYGLRGAREGQKSLRDNTRAPRRRSAAQPDPMPPPVHIAEYSDRQMTGWRPRSSENIVRRSTALLVCPVPRLSALGRAASQKHSRPSTASVFCGRRRRGARVRGNAAFRTRRDSPRKLWAIERVRSRTRAHVSCGRRPEGAAEPHN